MVRPVKGRIFRPNNDKSTDGLAFIILSQFKYMYLKNKTKQEINTQKKLTRIAII